MDKSAKTRPSVTAGTIKIDILLHNGRERRVKFHILEPYSDTCLRFYISSLRINALVCIDLVRQRQVQHGECPLCLLTQDMV